MAIVKSPIYIKFSWHKMHRQRYAMAEHPIFIFAFTWAIPEGRDEPPNRVLMEDKARALKLWMDRYCNDYIFQLEVTEVDEKDDYHFNPHFQGYFKTKIRTRVLQLARTLHAWFSGIHLSEASTNGIQALKDYSMKEETRFMGPWSKNPVYMGQDLWAHDLWPEWMKKLHAKLEAPTEDRKIIWVYDSVGGHGKSKMVKYYEWKQLGIGLEYESTANLRYQVCTLGPQRVYMLDMTKAKPKDIGEGDLYSALESIKNGRVRTGKYTGGHLLMDPPHVVVFANQMPEEKFLTQGRLELWDISDHNKASDSQDTHEIDWSMLLTDEEMPEEGAEMSLM